MISSWLVKVVLGIALIGVAVIELGSPLIARAQADDAAHNIANSVAFQLSESGSASQERLDASCSEQSAKESVELVSCEVNGDGHVEVRVRKEARSLLLGSWSVTEDWYRPTATAVSEREIT